MLPVIALVGQRNVGKSTLFNRLIGSNIALISNDNLGCTRDRQYGYMKYNQYQSIIIDTGGFDLLSNNIKIQNYINNQIILAIKEAHIVFFIVSGRFRESLIEYNIANYLRKLEKNIFLVVNKIDNNSMYHEKYVVYDYYILGMTNVIPISAIHGYGINDLLEKSFLELPKKLFNYNINNTFYLDKNSFNHKNPKESLLYKSVDPIRLAVVGRPNSGKSTFINFMLKTNRMITSNVPGTTRDSVYTSMMYDNQKYILIDTAGIRKRKKVHATTIEYISIRQTLQALKHAHVTLFMIDVHEGIVDQDLSLLKLISDYSKALVIVMNKWDTDVAMTMRKNIVESFLYTKIYFLNSAKIHFVSSLYGNGIESLFKSIVKVYSLSRQILSTSRLTRIMHKAIVQYPPPLIYGTRISPKPKYVHVGGYNPTIIIIHGTQVSQLSDSYRRYLKRFFCQNLCMNGIAIRMRFKDASNPFFMKDEFS